MPDIRIIERNGLTLATGLIAKPHDPKSEKYALTKTVPLRTVDLSQPRYLCGDSFDWRQAVDPFGQGQMGSCSAWGTGACAATAQRIALTQAGEDFTDRAIFRPHPTWLYYHARAIHGWQNEDTGSVPEDCLDLLMAGAPAMQPGFPFDYIADPRWVPVAELEQAPRFDYVLSYRPIYAGISDGYPTAAQIWLALDAGMPVNLAMAWPDAFFAPTGPGQAVLPGGVMAPPGSGGHDIWCWGLADGVAWCDNSWSPGWTPAAAQAGHFCRPGSFGIPLEYLGGSRNVLWSAQAVAYEPVPPTPRPDPEPEPDPGDFVLGYQAAKAAAWSAVNALELATKPSNTVRRKALREALAAVEKVQM